MNLILKIRSLSNHTIISIILYWIAIVSCLMLFSCDNKTIGEQKEYDKEIYEYDIKRYSECIIDSCEYFVMRSNSLYFTITHKGNCKNHIHYKKIVYDTVEYQIIKKK